MKKSDRKRMLTGKINEKNSNLHTLFKDCNLHIRNLPFEAKEEEINEVFSKFGEIKSIKIAKFILVSKEKEQIKEVTVSKGFGYVCFVDKDAARQAKEAFNEKRLPGYENAKRPLLIDYFQSKFERKQLTSNLQQQFAPNRQMFSGGMQFVNMAQSMFNNPNMMKRFPPKQPIMTGGMTGMSPMMMGKMNPMMNNQMMGQPMMNQMIVQKPQIDIPDIGYLNSLEEESAKKDYLGEFIFKNIENHPLTISKNLTIDDIGKITGMILGIEDINEIFEIAKNPSNLNSRINEALELLEQNK